MAKNTSRRKFLEFGLKAGLVIPFAGTALYGCIPKTKKNDINETSKKLKILILGGTSFLGPHQIAYALERGHSITTFTRGKTKPTVHKALFDKVEQLVGDRNDDLTALENRKWDAVIDNSGRKADWTKKSASLLKENCGLYLYTSSTGVYYPYIDSDFKESSKVLQKVPDGIDEELLLEYDYGVMKANSEQEAIDQFGLDRTIIVRPTYMCGPADRTDRFIHWPLRLKKGGEIMIPGKKEDPVQYIDVRDAAEWMIRLLEEKKSGTYNAVGPKKAQGIQDFVIKAQKTFDVESSFVQVDDYEFLKANQVYYTIPWIMPSENNVGSALINNQKAIENGLVFRHLTTSIKDIYNWWFSDAVSEERRKKFEANTNSVLAREQAILKKWKERK
jgi:2'-hydroxyisoflavone reductase